MPYKVEGVPRTLLDIYWPVCAPMLEKALDPSIETLEDVSKALKNERAMLWLVRNDADYVTGALVVTRQPGSLLVWLAGGKDVRGSLEAVEESLRRYAREHGLTEVRANVRPGLGRMMKNWSSIQETVVLNGLEAEDAHDDARDQAA